MITRPAGKPIKVNLIARLKRVANDGRADGVTGETQAGAIHKIGGVLSVRGPSG